MGTGQMAGPSDLGGTVAGTSRSTDTLKYLHLYSSSTSDASLVMVTVTLPFEQQFRRFADSWCEGTMFVSSPQELRDHPAFERIIALGSKAIAPSLDELKSTGDPRWYLILRRLTAAPPPPPDASADAERIRTHWLNWGREQGYLA